MENIPNNENKAFTYLLGGMSETDRDRFEERLFLDEDLSRQLDAAENDLIDEYLRDELTTAAHRAFESHFLLSERRRAKLLAAEILDRELFTGTGASAAAGIGFRQRLKNIFAIPRLAWAGGLAAVLLVVLAAVWAINVPPVEPDAVAVENFGGHIAAPPEIVIPPAAAPAAPAEPDTKSPAAEKETAPPPRRKVVKPRPAPRRPVRKNVPEADGPQIFAFTLLPPLRSRQTVIEVPPAAKTVRLLLTDELGKEYEKIFAELGNNAGEVIRSWEMSNKTPGGNPIVLEVPNAELAEGDYEIKLSGVTGDGTVDEINFYDFKVRRTP